MAGKSDVTVRFLGDTKSLDRATAKAHEGLSRIGTRSIAVGSALGVLAAGGITAVVGKLGDLVGEARAAEAAQRITAQVIKTTGGAAGVTAQQVDDLAMAISNKTGVDDDAVRSGENLLLTFTGIRNEVGKGNDIFNRATQTVTDMSVALGQDTKSSAIQLGKALNDPIKGITALQRVGVSFTESQKAQIATLVKSGDTLGAQKVILKELGREFGGAAAASADPMQKLGTTLNNIGKEVAGDLLPVLNRAADWLLNTGVPAVRSFAAWLGTHLGPIVSKVGGWVSTTLLPALSKLGDFITGTVVPAVQNLASGFMKNIWPAMQKVFDMVATNLQPAITALSSFWTDTLLPAIQRAWPFFEKVATVLGIVAGAVLVVVSWLIGHLVPAITKVIGWVVDIASTFLSMVGKVMDYGLKFIGWFKDLPGKIGGFVSGLWDGLKNGFKAALNWIIDRWNSFPKFTIPSIDIGPIHYGGGTLGLPTLPHLANGGIVKARPGGTLILAGEAGSDEAVVPLSRGRGMGGSRGGTTINLNIGAGVIHGTPLEVARQLKSVMQYGQLNGMDFGVPA